MFDWIKGAGVPNKYQPISLSVVYLLHDLFNEEEDKEFLQFIFEELIRKADSIEQVNFGFELLKGMKPKYEERKENFEDIKTRVESEGDENIKRSLISGLQTLQPEKLNQQNKDYWGWLDSLSEVKSKDENKKE